MPANSREPAQVTQAATTNNPNKSLCPVVETDRCWGGERVAEIFFRTNSSQLDPAERAKLVRLLAQMRSAHYIVGIQIFGNTDSIGNATLNLHLSEKRAIAVKEYLINSGWNASRRLDLEAHGSRRPIADNRTAQGRALNRRVVVVAYTGCTPEEQDNYVREGAEADRCVRELNDLSQRKRKLGSESEPYKRPQ
jgi:outer membrane protein OmpA-like peptidoglycan-associated protein